MKYLNLFVLTFLFACTESPAPPPTETPEVPTQETPTTPVTPPAENTEASLIKEVLGSYVGYFEAKSYDEDQSPSYSNKITIFLDNIQGDTMVTGHSVVAGNSRPFSGTIAMRSDLNHLFHADVKEPGDDRYDGAFSFLVDTKTKELSGSWKAFKKIPVWERAYTLQKRTFTYQPEVPLAPLSEKDWNRCCNRTT